MNRYTYRYGKINKRENAIIVIRCVVFISFISSLIPLGISIIIVSPLREWSVSFFWNSILLCLLSFPFGIAIGIVINRIINVKVSQPHERWVPLVEPARTGREVGCWMEILILAILFWGTLLLYLWGHLGHVGSYEYEVKIIRTLRSIHSAQEKYQDNTGLYGRLEDLKINGLVDRKINSQQKDSLYATRFRIKISKDGWFCITTNVLDEIIPARDFSIDQTGEVRILNYGR